MKKILLMILMSFLFIGCSHIQKEIDIEKRTTKEPFDRHEMIDQMRLMLDKSDRLTNEQKELFYNLHSDVIIKSQDITGEIRKLKVILFRHLTEQNYSEEKVKRVGREIEDLYKKKLNLMFEAMIKARVILGTEIQHVYPYHPGPGFPHSLR